MKFGIALFFVSVILSFVLLSPSVKKYTKRLFLDGEKEVLSQIELELQGTQYKIVKVKTMGGLGVELYKVLDGDIMLLDSHSLTDKKDAFYKFEDAQHNLFIKDINNDGQPDIILPSLDKNLKARLNVFNLDTYEEKLVKRSAH